VSTGDEVRAAVERARPELYRVIWLTDLGYVVYRKVFDDRKCSAEDGARAHRQSIFVTKADAEDYCRYRNRLLAERGSDALSGTP
jgi:hypothetical protein